MSWSRARHGNVRDGKLVHMVYVWRKEDSLHWESQCGILWGYRENRGHALQPKTTKRMVTCLRCMYLHLKHGWTW